MRKRFWIVAVCLVSIAAVMQGCGVGLLATLGAASSGSSGGGSTSSGPSAPPTQFILTVTNINPTSIRIDWTASANATSYVVERKVGPVGTWGELVTTGSSVVTLLHTDLTPGTIYYYKVKAVNSLGSIYSNEVNATTTKIQPDALIRRGSETDTDYIYNNLYNSDATSQTKRAFTPSSVITSYYIKVENDGDTADSFKITATLSGGAGWTVAFYAGASPITSDVLGSGWNTSSVSAGQFVVIELDVTPGPTIQAGSVYTVTVTASSNTASVMKDVVRSVTEAVDPSITTTWGGINWDWDYTNLDIDSNGNAYMCGAFQAPPSDAFFIKYNKDGTALRIKSWGGGSNDDYAYGIAAGSDNMYVCGETWSFSISSEIFVLKYGPTFDSALWETVITGTNWTDIASGIALDSLENVYVCGYTDTLGGFDVFLLELDRATGSMQSKISFDNTGNWDYARAIAVDSNDDVYICGNTNTGAMGQQALLLKYKASMGTFEWAKTWGGINTEDAHNIAIDSAGNIYLCGETDSFGASMINAFVVKIDTAGSVVWQKAWGGDSFDRAYGVAVDPEFNVYVCGTTMSFTGGQDGFLLKYDKNGNLLSQKIYSTGGPANNEILKDIKVNANNVYLSGVVQYSTNPSFSVVSGTSTDISGNYYQDLSGTISAPNFTQLFPNTTPWPSQSPGGGQLDASFLRRPTKE